MTVYPQSLKRVTVCVTLKLSNGSPPSTMVSVYALSGGFQRATDPFSLHGLRDVVDNARRDHAIYLWVAIACIWHSLDIPS